MCFAPQPRAFFPPLNFQKSSEPNVLWHFLLPNVLRATAACTFSTSQRPKVARTCGNLIIFTQNVLRAATACTFSTSQLPKVVRDRRALPLFTWKFASRHNGMHFFRGEDRVSQQGCESANLSQPTWRRESANRKARVSQPGRRASANQVASQPTRSRVNQPGRGSDNQVARRTWKERKWNEGEPWEERRWEEFNFFVLSSKDPQCDTL